VDISRSIGVEETFMEFSFPEYILQRQSGVLNEYEFISKLLPLFSPECNKTLFCNEICPSGFRKFLNLILLFVSFLFSYPCALDVPVFFSLHFLDVTRNRCVVLTDGGGGTDVRPTDT
jgi:hypothetical protein